MLFLRVLLLSLIIFFLSFFKSFANDVDFLKTEEVCVADSAYALVAGGSKGIGYAIAEALAKRNYNLILIARNMDGLIAAKNKLETQYPIHVKLLAYDLAKEETAGIIAKWCFDNQIRLKVLCNVAGFGGNHDYLTLPVDSVRYMIRLNLESTAVLTQSLLPLLESYAPSYILNVASMAGFSPIPEKNIYSATKSAVIFFSYALRYQLKEKNISVSCLAPGPVYTKPEVIRDTREHLGKFGDWMSVAPEKVGERAVKKTLKKKMLIVPGRLAATTSAVIRILPRRWAASIYSRL